MAVLGAMTIACIGTLPWTLGRVDADLLAGTADSVRYDNQDRLARHIPPTWAWRLGAPGVDGDALADAGQRGADTYQHRIQDVAEREALVAMARQETRKSEELVTAPELAASGAHPTPEQIAAARPFYLLGTDLLGRSLLVRCLAGGGISLTIGLFSALLSVLLGTVYGAMAGYVGGRTDAVMMRIVDVLYGLPYILLVVLLAVAVNSVVDDMQAERNARTEQARASWIAARQADLGGKQGGDAPSLSTLKAEAAERIDYALSPAQVQAVRLGTLLVAIGGVSWLTMARVVRGQVLSLKGQPFMEAARAMGVPVHRLFLRHLLPNLVGPIVVYATLTVPQAILQESFLSFLGIGVMPPLPSWGNLAADGLTELNPYKTNWWMILFPCAMLAATLLALNFVGESLREAFDPKSTKR